MKLSLILESVQDHRSYDHNKEDNATIALLNKAKTGVPIKIVAYRGQTGQINDRSRGVFYAPLFSTALYYAKGSGSSNYLGRKGHVIRANLKFENPLVANSTDEVLRYLINKSAIAEKIGNKFLKLGAYGNMLGERLIAAGARRCGHDGILYINGLDEIIDLR